MLAICCGSELLVTFGVTPTGALIVPVRPAAASVLPDRAQARHAVGAVRARTATLPAAGYFFRISLMLSPSQAWRRSAARRSR